MATGGLFLEIHYRWWFRSALQLTILLVRLGFIRSQHGAERAAAWLVSNGMVITPRIG